VSEAPDLESVLGEAILAGGDVPPLDLVVRAAQAEAITRLLLRDAVTAARATGASWADVGHQLGMSRQAAQQRFGDPREDDLGDSERWLGPVTAMDEMHELELAGQLGWHTVGCAPLRHRMVRTATRWEHRRVTWPGPARQLRVDGWQIGARAFPWVYLIRDTGQPAAAEQA